MKEKNFDELLESVKQMDREVSMEKLSEKVGLDPKEAPLAGTAEEVLLSMLLSYISSGRLLTTPEACQPENWYNFTLPIADDSAAYIYIDGKSLLELCERTGVCFSELVVSE